MTGRILLGMALLVAGGCVALFYQSAALSARGGEESPLYSVRRYDPYGTAALVQVLAARGVPVRKLERPSLEASDRGVLIQVLGLRDESSGHGFQSLQAQRLAEWISDGNTVVQFTRQPTNLMTLFKIQAANQPEAKSLAALHEFEKKGRPPAQTPARIRSAEWSLVDGAANQQMVLWSPMELALREDTAWRPIATLNGDGKRLVAAEYRIGKGKLTIVGAPTPALNGTLPAAHNLDFLLAVIGGGPVIIDEWTHGIGHEATVIGFIGEIGLMPALIQVVLLALLYVWSTAGRSRRDRGGGARQRSIIEQIFVLGALYGRSMDLDVVLERVSSEVKRRLAEAMRCGPEQISSRLATVKPELRAGVERVLARMEHIGRREGPRCRSCGYDLTLNSTGRCPECGTAIVPGLQRRIVESAQVSSLPIRGANRRRRVEAGLAEALSLSHQLVQEARRERSVRQ